MITAALKPLNALQQLDVQRQYPALIPLLVKRGLSLENAAAVAHNATLLFYALEADSRATSAFEVLRRFSLEEIAELCELYRQIEAGEAEYGVNTSYEEVSA